MSIQPFSRRTFIRTGTALIGGSLIPLHTVLAEPDSGAAIVLLWNYVALQAVRTVRPGVTVTTRAMAILHTGIYDAWAAYDKTATGTQFGRGLRQPVLKRTQANKLEAISYAAYRILVDLFPSETTYLNTIMTTLEYDPTITTTDLISPAGIGNLAALGILNYRRHDGANQLGDLHPGSYSDYTGYTPVNSWDHINNPNHWQPLRVSDGRGGFLIQHYLTPQWKLVKPFAIPSYVPFRPPVPATYPDNLYQSQAQQMLAYSANLSDLQKVIAEYWQDGPGTMQPPGHWCLHAQYVVQRHNYNLDQAVQIFFILTNALLDASIACWDTKSAYDSERPITAIHYLFQGQQVRAWGGPYKGTRMIAGEDWQPYQPSTIVSPAFPEHCSGHSTFSAASAFVLRMFTGSDYFGAAHTIAAGTSTIEPGIVPATDITLRWKTFSEAAIQAGLSRRYGGIHFARGDMAGRILGKQVGSVVWQKALTYIQGFA